MEHDFVRKGATDDMKWIARKMFGIAERARDPEVGEQILVGYQWRDGTVRWRTSLGRGTLFPAGHIAGTPVVVGDIAFVPAANNGNVVAVDTRTGRVIWSTPVKAARGSVVEWQGAILAATQDTTMVVLESASGRVSCRQKLPAVPDRAALTVSGATGVLTLRNGTVMARPMADWRACRA
jgi:outer membrane protein assembly factor BamB